jgi:hypothetical protein
VQKIEDETDRKKRFLSDLCRRGPEAYNLFAEVLYGVDQLAAAAILRPKVFESGLSQQQMIEDITNTPLDETVDVFPVGGDASDRTLHSPSTVASIETQEFMINVKKCKKEMKGKNIYRMNADPRGYCLIFNTFKFRDDCFPIRHGSETEANRLADVFTQLHFTVEIKTNESKEDMEATLKQYSKKPVLARHDALILIVLSHGQSGYVVSEYSRDLIVIIMYTVF